MWYFGWNQTSCCLCPDTWVKVSMVYCWLSGELKSRESSSCGWELRRCVGQNPTLLSCNDLDSLKGRKHKIKGSLLLKSNAQADIFSGKCIEADTAVDQRGLAPSWAGFRVWQCLPQAVGTVGQEAGETCRSGSKHVKSRCSVCEGLGERMCAHQEWKSRNTHLNERRKMICGTPKWGEWRSRLF